MLHDNRLFLVRSYHKQNSNHKPNLMPEESISNKMKIIYFISKVIHFTISLPLLESFYISISNCSLMVCSCNYIDSTKVNEVVSSNKVLHSLFHSFQVQKTSQEKVFILSLDAWVSGVELFRNLFTWENADVRWKIWVQHFAIV